MPIMMGVGAEVGRGVGGGGGGGGIFVVVVIVVVVVVVGDGWMDG